MNSSGIDWESFSCTGLCVLSSFIVGLSGIVPLFLIPLNADRFNEISDPVALHQSIFLFIAGIIFFFAIERLCAQDSDDKIIEGYLNLLANVIDNFSHGVAVGASFLVSNRLGFLTMLCILIHEIPHEVSDFVILLRSGFTRRAAAKAQLSTASSSIVGALFALKLNNSFPGWTTSCMLPITAGGFLYIGLTTLAPDILKEMSFKESLIHLLLVLFGIFSMLIVSIWFT